MKKEEIEHLKYDINVLESEILKAETRYNEINWKGHSENKKLRKARINHQKKELKNLKNKLGHANQTSH